MTKALFLGFFVLAGMTETIAALQPGKSAEFTAGEIVRASASGARLDTDLLKGGGADFSTRIADDRPILRLGPDARIQMLTAELNLYDPELKGVPLELDAGSRIERLNFSLNWQGATADRGKNPIVFNGGSIGHLNWIGAPP